MDTARSAALLCALLVAATAVTGAAGAAGAEGAGAEDPRFVAAGDDVEVWDRAALTVRVDERDAATSVDGPAVVVAGGEDVAFPGVVLDRDPAAYDDEARVRVAFRDRLGADVERFDDRRFDLLAVSVTDAEAVGLEDVVAGGSVPVGPDDVDGIEGAPEVGVEDGVEGSVDDGLESDAGDAEDLASDLEGPSSAVDGLPGDVSAVAGLLEAEEHVHVEVVAENRSVAATPAGFEATADLGAIDGDAEAYAFLVVEHGAVAVEDGEAQLAEPPVRVYGADVAPVAERRSSVSAPAPATVGEDVAVAVDADLDAERVDHAVALVDEERLARGSVTVELLADPTADLAPEDVAVSVEPAAVRGVAAVENRTRLAGQPAFGELFALLSGAVEGDAPAVEGDTPGIDGDAPAVEGDMPAVESGEGTLDASVTAVEGAPDATTLSVGTLGNWTPGEYELVHVAVDRETGTVATGEATLALSAAPAGDSGESASDGESASSVGGSPDDGTVDGATGTDADGGDSPAGDEPAAGEGDGDGEDSAGADDGAADDGSADGAGADEPSEPWTAEPLEVADDEALPGFGVLAALLALLAGGLAAVRRDA